MRRLSTAEMFQLDGGMDDTGNPVEMADRFFVDISNMMPQQTSLVKRNGYSVRFATALESGAVIQRVHQYEDNSQTRLLIYAVNGELYKDDDTTQTKLATSLSLATSQDALVSMVNYDGRFIGTDQTNRIFYWPDNRNASTGKLAQITARGMPSAAGVLTPFKDHLFFGDITDVDGSRYPYRLIHTQPGAIDRVQVDSNNDLNRNQQITGFLEHSESLLVFQSDSCYAGYHVGAPTGQLTTAFNYQLLSSRVGTPGPRNLCSTDRGTFLMNPKGIYWIPQGTPSPPIYVSERIEKFWGGINHGRLKYGCCAELPEKNGVVFAVPHGASQTNNNRLVFLYYGLEHEKFQYLTPAYGIWSNSASALAFNSLATILSSGRRRLVGAKYDGKAYTLDDGVSDVGEGIEWSCTTPMYAPGGRGREKIWYDLALAVDLATRKTITITITLYNDPTPYSDTISGGTANAAVLGSWTLGQHQLSSADLGRIAADLKGKSRYIQLKIAGGPDLTPITLHGILLFFKAVGVWP